MWLAGFTTCDFLVSRIGGVPLCPGKTQGSHFSVSFRSIGPSWRPSCTNTNVEAPIVYHSEAGACFEWSPTNDSDTLRSGLGGTASNSSSFGLVNRMISRVEADTWLGAFSA